MRQVISATVVALLGWSLPLAGCAGGVAQETQPGTGGSTSTSTTSSTGGSGGSGGDDNCTPEVCDGVDNNCDGVTDEGCECLAGDTRPCYNGPEGTEGIGACKAGSQACNPATNTFGPCVGEEDPAAEACNGTDDDCNGETDEAIADITCGIGACMATVPGCMNGQVGSCVPGQPSAEVCDGADNDCDQLVDENFPESGMACNSGLPGICTAGKESCINGELTCVPDELAGGEICDGLDNDCDGVLDNDVPGTGGDCSTGYPGVCSPGTISCQSSTIDCFPIVPPSDELCDGLDNDCDGDVDELDPGGGGTCVTGGLGACQIGTLHCLGATLVCVEPPPPSAEVCDGIDNDCDGNIDQGNPGGGASCSCGGTSACDAGLLHCVGCTKEVTCNDGLDDESDGAVDCADADCSLGCAITPCAAGQLLLVIKSTDLPKSILDNATATSTLTVSEAKIIRRAAVQLNITHTWDSDMSISLKSPANSIIDLSSGNGGSGDNYSNTIFDNSCGSAVTSAASPFSGCFTPEQTLATLNTQSSAGVWSLRVADGAFGDTGTLTAWSLALCVDP